MLFSRLVTSPIRPLLRLVVIEIVAKLTKIEQLKKSEQVGNTATENNLVCICARLWGGFCPCSPQRKPQSSHFYALSTIPLRCSAGIFHWDVHATVRVLAVLLFFIQPLFASLCWEMPDLVILTVKTSNSWQNYVAGWRHQTFQLPIIIHFQSLLFKNKNNLHLSALTRAYTAE